jgi:hypothetical protein
MLSGAAFESDFGNNAISSDALCQNERAVAPFDQFSR